LRGALGEPVSGVVAAAALGTPLVREEEKEERP
jgi:hypothetical protein